ncbi:roadblock/LC7 domain-containing protein [Streptomyces sp. S1A]|uniref:roadblock/LC7 domain-containing protein n=1 Tax=Streptomyces sp. ICN903 TaxID=2964654 RepID=UPI001EDC06E5|nr:roadblock/LC7 domain-containing protein [Streptomyces sp. ICN903]MCG3040324.1 roadblock/LC7 domain-containing protein [Streptomyces sp. ICN903]
MAGTQRTGGTDPKTWLIQGLVERNARIRSAALVTSDGLIRAAHGLDDTDTADVLAAIVCGLYSLARGAAARIDAGPGPHPDGDVRQMTVELARTLLFVRAAGVRAHLAVIADRDADPAVVGYETARLVRRVRTHLAAPARTTAAPGTAG